MGFVVDFVEDVVDFVGDVVGAVVGVVGKVVGGLFGWLVPKPKMGGDAKPPNNLTKQLNPDEPRKIVFGKIAAPLDTRYWEVWGEDGEKFDEVLAVATHRINGFKELYIEEKLAIDAAGVVQSAFTGVLTRQTRTGAVGQTGLIAGGGAQYNATSTFDGCAAFLLRWIPNEEKLPNGIPSRYTQIVEGAPVYDPRRDSTQPGGSGTHRINDRSTWAYATLDSNGQPIGRNNALQALWYLLGWIEPTKNSAGVVTGEMLVAGRGVDPSDINLATFIAGANACEAAAYYTDLCLSTEDEHTANEDAITCHGLIGRLIDPGGLWSYYANVNDTANIAVELTDADILDNAPIEWTEFQGLSEQFNQVGGKFINPNPPILFQSFPYPLVRDATYEANLGFKKRKTLDFRQVLDNTLAQRLARLALNEAQYQGELNANWNYKALRAQAWSIVRYTSERFGWTKLFRVWRHEITAYGGVGMTLREVHASIWSAGTVAAPVDAGDVINALAAKPISPVNVLMAQVTTTGADGTKADGIRITWNLPSLAVRRTEIRFRKVGDANWISGGTVERDTTGVIYSPLFSNTQYEAQIRHISVREVAGPWTPASNSPLTTGTESNLTFAQIELAAATANWSQVYGTGKPDDYADVTGDNVASGIVGQGEWATYYGSVSSVVDALGTLADQVENLASDDILSAVEKRTLISINSNLQTRYIHYKDRATILGISTVALVAAKTAWDELLASYNPLWNDTTQDTLIYQHFFDDKNFANWTLASGITVTPNGPNYTLADANAAAISEIRRGKNQSGANTYSAAWVVQKDNVGKATRHITLYLAAQGGAAGFPSLFFDTLTGQLQQNNHANLLWVKSEAIDYGDYWLVLGTVTLSAAHTSVWIYMHPAGGINFVQNAAAQGSMNLLGTPAIVLGDWKKLGKHILNARMNAFGKELAKLFKTISETDAELAIQPVGPTSGNVQYSNDGTAVVTPLSVDYYLKSSTGVVTTGVTANYKVITGTVNGFTSASAAQNLAVSGGVADFNVNTLGSNTARVEVRLIHKGVTRTIEITLTKTFAPPSTGGSGSTLASQSSGFTSITSNSFVAITGSLIMTLPAGKTTARTKINLNPHVFPKPTSGGSSWNCEYKVERLISGTWTQVGALQNSNPDARIEVVEFGTVELDPAEGGTGEPGTPVYKEMSVPGEMSATIDATGLTAGTNVEIRISARITGTLPNQPMNFSGSVEVSAP
jgi:hypothetical protein